MNNKRREKIKTAISYIEKANNIIEDVLYESEDARDNIPDNLSGSPIYEMLEDECYELSDVVEYLNDSVDGLEGLL